uniref:F-box domain-containing protein n=1 Tax=Moniliophthora roreri TaxID=221103 RepID=A0A0W0F804_MONRR
MPIDSLIPAAMVAPSITINPRVSALPMPPADLQNRLRQSAQLSPCEDATISQFIQDAEHDMQMYERYVQQFNIRQVALQLEIARYKSLKSPIRRLPRDILEVVFLHSAPVNNLGVGRAWYSAAFDLSSVCHQWREVAIDCPTLWCNIASSLSKRAKEPVEICLSRSKNHPLSLKLSRANDGDEGVFSLLLAHSNRWVNLDMDFNILLSLARPSGEFDGRLPLLKSALYEGPHPRAQEFLNSLSTAPKLRQLTCVEHIPPGSFRWSSIRDLCLVHLANPDTPRYALDALRECQHLESLVYCGWRHDGTTLEATEYTSPGVPLPPTTSHIRSITIQIWQYSGIYSLLRDLFQPLTLPSVTTISIHGQCYVDDDSFTTAFDGSWPYETMVDFLTRSHCALTTLELLGMPLYDDDVVGFLRLVPSLEDLTIHELWADADDIVSETSLRPPRMYTETITVSFFEQLNVGLAVAVFDWENTLALPKLRRLCLRVREHFDADEAFVDMVQSRWYAPLDIDNGVSIKLKEVELIVLDKDLDETLYEPLKWLEKDGMMVTVRGNGKYIV